MRKRLLRRPVLMAFLLAASGAFAADAPDDKGNAFGQFTYIVHSKRAFPAAYTNVNGTPNSLVPERERSFTTTATAYLGLRAWKGTEFYFAPELISELPLSGLRGLGGSIQNGELEKNGLRQRTLEAIKGVKWFPAWGEERISNMIASRPDSALPARCHTP